MIIKLLLTGDEKNKVVKSTSEVGSYTCTLKEATSVVAPTIIIADDLDPSEFNYAYIEAFSRYYYVTNIVNMKNGLWMIDLKCDVLMSFADDILDNNAVIARQENDYNSLLSDPRVKVAGVPYVQTLQFPQGFTGSYSYALCVGGNSGDEPNE